MPYNPGTANHAGALLAQGASSGIHSLANSHRRIGEMLKAEEEKRKQERMKAKGYQTLLKADPAMEKIMGERLGLTSDKFMDLSVEEQVAVGDGLMMLPGLTQAFQAIESNNINNVRGSKDLARYDREKALSDALASGQISAVELSNMAKEMGLRGFEDRQAIEDGIMAQNYRRGKAEADMAEKDVSGYDRARAITDALRMQQLAGQEITNVGRELELRGMPDRLAVRDSLEAQSLRRGKAQADISEKEAGRFDLEKKLNDALRGGQIESQAISNQAKKIELEGLRDRLSVQDKTADEVYNKTVSDAIIAKKQADDYEKIMGMKDAQMRISEMNARVAEGQLRQRIKEWEIQNLKDEEGISMAVFIGMDNDEVDEIIASEKNPEAREALVQAAERYYEYKQLQRKAEQGGMSPLESWLYSNMTGQSADKDVKSRQKSKASEIVIPYEKLK